MQNHKLMMGLNKYRNNMNYKKDDIQKTIKKFQEYNKNGIERYASFDYCYNHFKQPSSEILNDIEKSCLIIGFYLASWGMLRGSSFLLQKSAKHYEPLVRYIAKKNKSLWDLDVDNYTNENINEIIEVYEEIKNIMITGNHAHLTLITKIMLGVFGIIPAFDTYFCTRFKEIFKNKKCGFSVVNKKSLGCIRDFYTSNKKEIDAESKNIYTRDFADFKNTKFNYPKVKIIDMYGFAFTN